MYFIYASETNFVLDTFTGMFKDITLSVARVCVCFNQCLCYASEILCTYSVVFGQFWYLKCKLSRLFLADGMEFDF